MFISDLNLSGSPILSRICVKQSRTLENPSVADSATVNICREKGEYFLKQFINYHNFNVMLSLESS